MGDGWRARCYLVGLALALALGACGGRALQDDAAGGADSGVEMDRGLPDLGVDMWAREASQDRPCSGRLDYDVRVRASGLERWEGRRAWAFASKDLNRHTNYDFLITGRVLAGGVDFLCRDAIADDLAYPGIVFWIDVDESGICEPNVDLVSLTQFYGWLDDVDLSLTAMDMGSSVEAHACDRVNSWL